jgi:lipopolysaccharide transport system permease protein
MKAYLADVWRFRHFWLSLVRMDLQARYRRSVLGIGWSLLHPVATTLVLCAVFYKIFHMPVQDYLPFLMAGLAWWGYVTGVIGRGCQCFVEAEGYIRQHSLPMAVYPLRSALGAMIHCLIALTVVLLLTWCFKGFGNLAALPILAVGLIILLIFGWGVGVLAGYVNAIFRDIQHLTDIIFQILFYLTPIMYPPEVLVNTGMTWVLRFNPLTHLLKIIRDPIVAGHIPSWRAYGAATATTLIVVAVATLLLGRLQRKVILYL